MNNLIGIRDAKLGRNIFEIIDLPNKQILLFDEADNTVAPLLKDKIDEFIDKSGDYESNGSVSKNGHFIFIDEYDGLRVTTYARHDDPMGGRSLFNYYKELVNSKFNDMIFNVEDKTAIYGENDEDLDLSETRAQIAM
jgi:hypothetical protein